MKRFERHGKLERERALSEIAACLETVNADRYHAGKPALGADSGSVLGYIMASYQGRHEETEAARAVRRLKSLEEYIYAAELLRGAYNRLPDDQLPGCLSPSSRGKLENGTLIDLLNAEMERAVEIVAEALNG